MRLANTLSLLLALTLMPVSSAWSQDATTEYQAAMSQMMSGMMVPYTDDPDVDFIKGMIPHHQGAVDNARIVLKYGKDPEVRKFAEAVIAAQEAEIAWMNDWLAKQGK